MLSSHEINVIEIPFIPKEIDAATLDEQGRLAGSSELQSASSISTTPSMHQKLSKKTYHLKHAWIKTSAAFFTISGKKGTAGKGSSGKVKWVQNANTGRWFVIKEMKIKNNKPIREIAYLDKMDELIKEDNKCIYLQYFGTKGRKKIFMMQGKTGINLHDYIVRNIKSSLAFKLNIIINLIAACEKLKKECIFHGDIKLENIMIDPASGEVFLIDYGYSEHLNNRGEFEKPLASLKGTPKYLAPEMLLHFKDLAILSPGYDFLYKRISHLSIDTNTLFPEKITMYSIGMVAAEFLNFIGLEDESLTLEYSQSDMYTGIDKALQDDLKDFIKGMLSQNPQDRPDYQEAIQFFADISKKIKENQAALPLRLCLFDLHKLPIHSEGIIYLAVHHSEVNQNTINELSKKKNQLERDKHIVSRQAFVYSSKEELAQFLKDQHIKTFAVDVIDSATGESFFEQPSVVATSSDSQSNTKISYIIR